MLFLLIACWEILHAICRLLNFFKKECFFFKKKSWTLSEPGHQSVKISLDSDQARHFVGPDLGPNCLKKLSADGTSRIRDDYALDHCCGYALEATHNWLPFYTQLHAKSSRWAIVIIGCLPCAVRRQQLLQRASPTLLAGFWPNLKKSSCLKVNPPGIDPWYLARSII